MARLLEIPDFGTAEEDVLVGEWLLDEGAPFEKGDTLAVVETLKASFEVEAPQAGVLVRRLAEGGARVPTRSALAVLAKENEQVPENEIRRLIEAHAPKPVAKPAKPSEAPVAKGASTRSDGSAAASPAARTRARELGVSLDGITGTGRDGLIRSEDVELAAQGAGTASGGRVSPEFLAHVRSDTRTFGALSSEFKVALYTRFGARIGRDVHLAPGAVILADVLELGDECRIGEDCRIEAQEFRAGDLLQLSRDCSVRCRKVQIGDNAFFAHSVEIGGGGAMDPEAELRLGSHGFVGEGAHLNPCRLLTIGDEVVISRGAVVMTHSFGGSVMRGFPNRFAPVVIGDCSQIGIGATLFPGVELGAGSVLLSGSSLVTSMPPGRLYGGVPAEDLKSATRELSTAEGEAVARELVVELGRQLSLRGMQAEVDEGPVLALEVVHDGGRHLLRIAEQWIEEDVGHVREDVRLCMSLDDSVWESIPPDVTAVDFSGPRIRGHAGPLANALREFLRKRGVRLQPRSWTYPGGWL